VRRFGHSHTLVVPVASLAFALGGVLDNMKEEIIALVPVMLLLARRLGYRPVVAVAMSLGAAAVGAAFSPINPFQVGIAQQLAQLPLLSGWLFRIAFLAAALGIWVWGTLACAARRFRAGDLRHARGGAHRGHDRARVVHAGRPAAARARGARDDGRARPGARTGTEPQRSRGAHAADSRAPLGPAGPVTPGHGPRVPIRRRTVRALHAHERGAHGDPRRRAGPVRRVAAVRPAPAAHAAGTGSRRDRTGRGDRPPVG